MRCMMTSLSVGTATVIGGANDRRSARLDAALFVKFAELPVLCCGTRPATLRSTQLPANRYIAQSCKFSIRVRDRVRHPSIADLHARTRCGGCWTRLHWRDRHSAQPTLIETVLSMCGATRIQHGIPAAQQ